MAKTPSRVAVDDIACIARIAAPVVKGEVVARRSLPRFVASCCLMSLLVMPMFVQAQMEDADIVNRSAVPEDASNEESVPSLELPATLPAVVGFADMMPFEIDSSTPNTFALDPASVRLQERYVLATVAVRSPSGAVTSGFYGFACGHAQYRLLAYPRKNDQWRPASQRVKWRDVIDGETRNRHFRAVFRAGCRVGGRSAESVDEVLRYLRQGRIVSQ